MQPGAKAVNGARVQGKSAILPGETCRPARNGKRNREVIVNTVFIERLNLTIDNAFRIQDVTEAGSSNDGWADRSMLHGKGTVTLSLTVILIEQGGKIVNICPSACLLAGFLPSYGQFPTMDKGWTRS